MTKWKRLRRGKSARHVTFSAQTVASVDSKSSIDPEPTVSRGGAENNTNTHTAVSLGGAATETIAACREPITKLNLNRVDPYGCLDICHIHRNSSTLGAYLNRDVEEGETLAIYTRDLINADQLYDGRERRFIIQRTLVNGDYTTTLTGDGVKGKETGSYVRDHPTLPTDANTEVTVRLRGNTPELVVVALTRIAKGQEAHRNYGLDHYLHEMKNKQLRAKLLTQYAPLIPAAQRSE